MNDDTINRLVAINYQFYQNLGESFSLTRQRIQPGVRRIISDLPITARVLDLGCGNGELSRELARRGFKGSYTGLDFSHPFLDEARQTSRSNMEYTFFDVDITQPGWDEFLGKQSFDVILMFAALHHIPGFKKRLEILCAARSHLNPMGSFIHSEWQFLNSPRLRARVLPWETVGLCETDVDLGDYLLDWRHAGYGLRYVHYFNIEELAYLASESGFQIVDTFYSDGHGGNLGLYQIWQIR
jgi:tRNA (uracil-5-)-methyltransferase TRM9